jgi:hypothetical protein
MHARWAPVPTAVHAETSLGFRLASRHGPARTAAGWAIGLAVFTRVVGGPAAPERLLAVAVAFGGLLGAAAGPRLVVRGGPLETLRWASLPTSVVVLARVLGAVAFAGVTTTVVTLVLGESALPIGAVVAAAGHAGLLAALAAGLAPRVGCAATTGLLSLLVAAGIVYEHYPITTEVPAWVHALTPPGVLLQNAAAGAAGGGAPLWCWFAMAAAGLVNIGRVSATRRYR